MQFSKQVTYAGMSTAGKSIWIIINEQSNKYADSYESIIMVYFKSNQIKSFITRRLIFLQYKYHIEKYNPREGKLIWGARFS